VIVKPAVVLLAIASCVPGCQLVFPLASTVDKVPHVPEDQNEEPGLGDFVAPPNFSSYDTTMAMQAFPGVAEFEKIKQDGADLDVVVMRVGTLTIGAGSTFRISGDTAFLVIARTIQIDGTLDASAFPDGEPAPGGGRPGMGDAGEGSAGLTGGDRINTGGGGGGMASGAGAGGTAACLAGIPGGAGGSEVGDAELNILVGGGAGGIGGQRCAGARPRGGFGGGALQLSATESITISASGRVIASGGGGGGGAGADACRGIHRGAWRGWRGWRWRQIGAGPERPRWPARSLRQRDRGRRARAGTETEWWWCGAREEGHVRRKRRAR
jgi:hypothetical protein